MEKMSRELLEKLEKAKTIGIAGHLRPDGDCVGACLSWCQYIERAYPNARVEVFLEHVPEVFLFLNKSGEVISDYPLREKPFDIFFSLDCSNTERLGGAEGYYNAAACKVNIDHHISNSLFGDFNFVEPLRSATCEVLYELMEPDLINASIAEALYVGIIHDTGVFHHSNTSRRTHEIAGELTEYNIPFSDIIDETFYEKTLIQNQLLGTCLVRSRLLEGEKVIASYTTCEDMEKYNAVNSDLEGIVNQLRITKGVEAAIFLHELEKGIYKVSMRANTDIDLTLVALKFGGGGHKKAAGCTMKGSVDDILLQLTEEIKKQF